MSTKLNIKQWALASFVVFAIITVITFIMLRLGAQSWVIPPSQGQAGTITNALSARFATYLSRIILSGLFTYIFTKTNHKDQSGIVHGLRFGFGIGLLMYIPNFITYLVYSDLSTAVLAAFMMVGVIQSIVCGAAIAYIYKPDKTAAK